MQISFFFQGVVIGFTLAAVVGPIGLLVMQRTLARGWRYGMVSGLGVAVADGSYGFIGALGLSLVTSFLMGQQIWLRLVGGLILIYLGISILRSPFEAESQSTDKASNYLMAFTSIIFLTFSNPATILSFAAVFAGLNIIRPGESFAVAAVFGGAIFVGSLLWWLVIVGSLAALRARFNPRVLAWTNRIAGVLIAVFGVIVLASLFFKK
ncbi:MAG: LysE family translocator [Chloroflexi bacterium]|nr:MAG: LysE family translocator [Chloroflexota bacterium]MBL1196796.1 LysE family translocator [Chloroflexota bacterium]NOH14090.1 LysE family transporter [Chloroflexota bacterium]